MRRNVVLSVLGSLLLFLAAAPLAPLAVAVWEAVRGHEIIHAGPPGWVAFLVAAAIPAALGLLLRRCFRPPADFEHLEPGEGFAVVTFGWLITGLIGAIPYLFLPALYRTATDCLFESLSGFTTTGATVLTAAQIDRELPDAFQLWRVLTHWLGGMGILLMVLAVLPTLGAGGIRACRAEPGLSAERLTPRIRDTVMIFVKIYIGLTVVTALLLLLAGLSLFDAVCHALSALATGGFSTRGKSIAGFNNLAVEIIIIGAMVAAAMNYVFYYFVFYRRRPREAFRHTEPRAYLGFLLVCLLLCWSALCGEGLSGGEPPLAAAGNALRRAAFQVCAIGTTTGFATDDYSVWPLPAKFVILLLMFTGGCAGSTGGGLKIGRLLLLIKAAAREARRVALPRRVVVVTLDGRGVSDDEISRAAGFFTAYLGIAVVATVALALVQPGLDLETAGSAAVAALGSIGPGMGPVIGPAGDYHSLNDAAKLILTLLMLLGRLELYAVLVLFLPRTWR